MLEKLGYDVIVAHGGEEAVSSYRERKDRIDLVIMDMIMPGMSGSGTFRIIRKINPHAKILLSSGYSINGQAQKIWTRAATASSRSLSVCRPCP